MPAQGQARPDDHPARGSSLRSWNTKSYAAASFARVRRLPKGKPGLAHDRFADGTARAPRGVRLSSVASVAAGAQRRAEHFEIETIDQISGLRFWSRTEDAAEQAAFVDCFRTDGSASSLISR